MSNSKFEFLEQFAAVSKHGRLYRCKMTVEDLGVRDDIILAASGEAAGVPLYNLCDMPNTEPPMKIHIYAASNIGMAVRLRGVRLNTWWTMVEQQGQPVMVPSFSERESIERALEWTPPTGCVVYMVVRNSTPYLIAIGQHPTKLNWRAMRIPLPNIYADARICMGREFAPPSEGSYVQRLRVYLDHFHMSRWNTDLLAGDGDGNRAESSRRLVRFSLDGKCLPPLNNWYEDAKEVSHSSYNWLVAMAQARGEAP